MDPEYAQMILTREANRLAAEQAEIERAALEQAELAAALQQAEVWRAEWARLLAARPGLRAELASIDGALPAAVDALKQAHAAVESLLARRSAAVNEANRINGRLSRLSVFLGGLPWMQETISVLDVDLPWRTLQFVARPWPK